MKAVYIAIPIIGVAALAYYVYHEEQKRKAAAAGLPAPASPIAAAIAAVTAKVDSTATTPAVPDPTAATTPVVTPATNALAVVPAPVTSPVANTGINGSGSTAAAIQMANAAVVTNSASAASNGAVVIATGSGANLSPAYNAAAQQSAWNGIIQAGQAGLGLQVVNNDPNAHPSGAAGVAILSGGYGGISQGGFSAF